MSTTLLEAEAELSKQLGDYWASTTTSTGTAETTVTDTALAAKEANWITDECYDMITSKTTYIFTVTSASATIAATYTNNDVTFTVLATIVSKETLYCSATSEPASSGTLTKVTGTGDNTITFSTSSTFQYEERKVSSLASTVLTTLAHSGLIATATTYEIHRLFSASEKRRALVSAAHNIYPACFKEIWDESLVSGNWLKGGSFERWDDANTLTDWTDDETVILTQTSDSPYYKHGSYSCKLGTAAGYIHQDITNFDDLKHLAGKTVTFTVQGYCATASTLRIAIYDGTTTTYSSYRTAEGAWTEHNDPLKVTATIQDNPTVIEFHIILATANDAYIDDARVISDYRGKTYIGNLGLAKDRPHQVFIEPTDYSQQEDWIRVRDYKVDGDGCLYIPTTYPSDYRLRIRGIGYLDFLASGVSSTAWTATIDLDAPELEILVAQAALYLYTWMAMPNYESGEREVYQQMMGYWKQELAERIAKFKMIAPSATIHWGIH